MRVAALYKGVRWVTWTLWIGYALAQVIRAVCHLLGTLVISRMLARHQGSSSLTLPHVANMGYSHIGRQCLPTSAGKLETLTVPILATLTPTSLDLFLLILTIVKAVKSSALSESHPSSPIVCVVLDFDLWLKLIFNPQDARTVEPRASVRISVGTLHLTLICLPSQVFSYYCESAQRC